MSKHTPGPWLFHDDDPKPFACYSMNRDPEYEGVIFASRIYLQDGGIIALVPFWHDLEYLPDLRLIAAAPDMLTALKAFVAEFTSPNGERIYQTGDGGDEYPCASVWNAANAAIAKAEGTTQ